MRPDRDEDRPRGSVRAHGARRAWALGLLGCGAAMGCFTSGEGLGPPEEEFYFPTGLVVSPGRTALYVANSDFDLQYNGGTVQELDLAAMRAGFRPVVDNLGAGKSAKQACAGAGLVENSARELYPGPCSPIPSKPLIRQHRIIGAFASGAVLVHRSDAPGARLFVPVRGDPSVTYFDVVDDRPSQQGNAANVSPCADARFCLECLPDARGRCSAGHLVGQRVSENQRGLVLPPEPVGIAAWESPTGDAIVVAHQSASPTASLIVNRWAGGVEPSLEFLLTGLSTGPTEVASLPVPGIVKAHRDAGEKIGQFNYQPGFLVTFRSASELDILRYHDDEEAAPRRGFLSRAGAIGINVNATGEDSRGIAVDATDRNDCEATCTAGNQPCLRRCAETPIPFYVANRSPASLLVGQVETTLVESVVGGVTKETAAYDTPSLYDTVPLSFGASKVALGRVVGTDGQLHRRVFAVAFDSRFVFSYDPEARRIDAVIRTGRGPHAIAFDTGDDGDGLHSFMYIGHFTDSYIGVVDLDMRRPGTFGSMVATIGQPLPPRESK